MSIFYEEVVTIPLSPEGVSLLVTRIMGQLVEWPEVITEGKTIEECRAMVRDALREMMAAYKQQSREIPCGGDLLEQVPVEA